MDGLITRAIELREWAVVAHLIEHHKISELTASTQNHIIKNGELISKNFIKNLSEHYEHGDVRPRLFQLLDHSNPHALGQLAAPYHELIQHTLETVELNMIKKKIDLNKQNYRHQVGKPITNKETLMSLKNPLICASHIKKSQINLNIPVTDQKLIHYFAQLKEIIAKNEISPSFLNLDKDQENYLDQLIENPSFKGVIQQELELYSLMKLFNLADTPFSDQPSDIQNQWNKAIAKLHHELKDKKLPLTFVLSMLQSDLKSYQANLVNPKLAMMKNRTLLILLPPN